MVAAGGVKIPAVSNALEAFLFLLRKMETIVPVGHQTFSTSLRSCLSLT